MIFFVFCFGCIEIRLKNPNIFKVYIVMILYVYVIKDSHNTGYLAQLLYK